MDQSRFLPHSELKEPLVRLSGEGRPVSVLGDRSIFKVLPEETGGAYAVIEQLIPPGHGPPLHVHRHETELFYIVDGEFELTIGDQRVRALPGALVAGPRDVPHTFQNVGTVEGKLLLTVIPGNFANFFSEVDQVDHTDHEAIRTLCAKYGVEILE